MNKKISNYKNKLTNLINCKNNSNKKTYRIKTLIIKSVPYNNNQYKVIQISIN